MKQYKGVNAKFQTTFDGYEAGVVASLLTADVKATENPYFGIHDEEIRVIKRSEDKEPEPVDCLEAMVKMPALVFGNSA